MKKVEDNIENMVVPCWIYQNDHGIPHDVCDYYVKKHENKKFTLGKTGIFEKQEKVDKNVRDVKKIDLPTFTGVTSYLIAAALDANFQNWNYHLNCCSQSEYLIYTRNGRYTTHIDYEYARNQEYVRKLTCITILNDKFKGGLFYIINGNGEKHFPPQEKGNIIIFPSNTLHGCETVYEGQRHAVVAWMSGKQFV
tara:strand:- start:111 stop:695 length:585 start_codon:yes stop_codon:yes gene_type:complete